MSTTMPPRHDHGADPWWADDAPVVAAPVPSGDSAAARPARPRRRTERSVRPLWLRLLTLPLTLLGTWIRRSPRLRSLLLRLVVVGIITVVVGGAVGVVLLNNVVMRRTAELGRLDNERRELRRDNAMLGAEAAGKSSQAQVVRRAERDLGMVRASGAPTYTYLEPSSVGLTPYLRALRARKAAAAARAAAGGVPAAPKTATPKKNEAP